MTADSTDSVKLLAATLSALRATETNPAVVLRCDWHHSTLWFADLAPFPSTCPAQLDRDGVLCLLPLTVSASALVIPTKEKANG